MKQTSVEHIGRSQLIPGVVRTCCRCDEGQCASAMLERYHDGLDQVRLPTAQHASRLVRQFAAFYSQVPYRYPSLFEELCLAC